MPAYRDRAIVSFPATHNHRETELKKVALRLAVVREYKYKKVRKITGIIERKPSVYELFIDAQEK